MTNKFIFDISMKLVDSLELIKSKINNNKKYDLVSIRNLFKEFDKVLTQHTNDSVLNSNHYMELIHFNNNLDELLKEEHISKAITDIHQILVSLQIEAPKLLFLLTAPFDEEAKTGDGQYAESLVHGFKNYDKNTTCIWLKEKESHYKLPIHTEIAPIPKNTIPSVYALQPVANGHTVLCGRYYSIKKLSNGCRSTNVINNKIYSPKQYS